MKNLKFSLPLWPGLTPDELERVVIPTLLECRDVIADLYFTSRVKPFGSDAMGGIIVTEEVAMVHSNSMVVGERTGIPVSATFNNIQVNPSHSNYKLFVKSFRPMYEAGVTSMTIPFPTWLRFGLKEEFPNSFVKNTILRKISESAEVFKQFEIGFDYINLDRNLIRNEDRLKEVKRAKLAAEQKLGRKLYLSLLHNEMCDNFCAVQDDHYGYNFARTQDDPGYFNSEMKNTASCVVQDDTSPEYILRAASIPSLFSQLNHFAQYVDVLKMHGRESKAVFFNSLDIIRAFKRREPMTDPYVRILAKVDPKVKSLYLNTIKNCKFNCWDCKVCSAVSNNYLKNTHV
jgi:hypothetical protein